MENNKNKIKLLQQFLKNAILALVGVNQRVYKEKTFSHGYLRKVVL